MPKLLDLLRPSQFLGYPIMIYAIAFGVIDGSLKLWVGDGHTHDYAVAYGLGSGLAVVLGLLLSTRIFYWTNSLFLRYLQKIRSHLDRTVELMGPPSTPRETPVSGTNFLFRGIAWSHFMLSAGGAGCFGISLCHVLIRLAIGFPDWTAGLPSVLTGLAIMTLGMLIGLTQLFWLDYQGRKLRRIVVAHINEEMVFGAVADGTAVVSTMQTGEKLVGNLTGVRSNVPATA